MAVEVNQTNQVVDPSILDSYRSLQEDGQPDVVTEFIDLFLEDLPKRLHRLSEVVGASNATDIRAAAHALKGSAGSVGAVALSGACAQLEALARAGSTSGAAELLTRILAESERATDELQKHRRP